MLMSENWAIKYRPQSLDEIVGQEGAVDQIRGMVAKKILPA
jgi:DNA polymerase III gamma/tau subunit